MADEHHSERHRLWRNNPGFNGGGRPASYCSEEKIAGLRALMLAERKRLCEQQELIGIETLARSKMAIFGGSRGYYMPKLTTTITDEMVIRFVEHMKALNEANQG